MPGSMSRSWRRDSNETASDEPGAVHSPPLTFYRTYRPRDVLFSFSFVMELVAARSERRCAGCFTFGAVRCCRAVRTHVGISAIKVGEFVTHCKFVGRKIPARVGVAAALHFQCERRRPCEFVGCMLGHRLQQPDRLSHLLGGGSPALGRAINHVDVRFRLIRNAPMRL
jgi:hypothetical protein